MMTASLQPSFIPPIALSRINCVTSISIYTYMLSDAPASTESDTSKEHLYSFSFLLDAPRSTLGINAGVMHHLPTEAGPIFSFFDSS